MFARARRFFLLRVVYPRFAAQLFPRRSIPLRSFGQRFAAPTLVASGTWDGRVRLLTNEPFPICPPVDWKANPKGHALWSFRLHEWEWAYPLVREALADDDALKELAALLRDYNDTVAIGDRIAYEPYPLSRRLVVWSIALHVLFERQFDALGLNRLAMEIDRGARLLAETIEHDLDNNHVIANAKGLAFAGSTLAQPYARQGYDLMWEQLRAQVRTDGVHVENSMSYHFQVWRDAIETCLLAREFNVAVPSDIPPRLVCMGNFLAALRYPDGTFPLLNDSVNEGFEMFDLLRAALCELTDEKISLINSLLRVFQDSGYATLQQGDTHVLFDAGALGPVYCPGHGHADTLSFELWTQGGARILDPGVYQYEAGAWRDYFRGTAAHNTLQVDDLDSSEVGGSFRVGRMANGQLHVSGDGNSVCGEHDGYARLKNPIWHSRTLALPNEHTLHITDEIRGTGVHDYALHFHLAPESCVDIQGDKARIQFKDGVVLSLEIPGAPALLNAQDGWVSPTWYTKISAPIIELRWRGEPPFVIRSSIQVEMETANLRE